MFVVASFLFIVSVALSFIEERMSSKEKVISLIGMVLVMVTYATSKDQETTADVYAYLNYFQNNDDPLYEVMTEPTYIYLSRFLISVGANFTVLLFIYAIITIPLKIAMLYKMTPNVFTALAIYIPVYYLLQDVIQIRAGAAAAFLMLSMYLVSNRKYPYAWGAFFIGVLFHYSALSFFPILLWGNRKLNIYMRCFLAFLVVFSVIVYIKGEDLLSILPSYIMEGKLDLYKDAAETGSAFSEALAIYADHYLMAKVLLLVLCLFFYNTIVSEFKYVNICLVMLTASVFMYISINKIPVIAGRIGDLYGMADAIVFTFCLSFVKPTWITKCGIGCVGLYKLVYTYLFAEYVV